MLPEEQLEVLRHWVGEGSLAVDDAAFISAYEEVRKDYVESQNALGYELGNPLLNPLGRIAQQRLVQARTTLVIFCTKAIDNDKKSAGLGKLKNSILEGTELNTNARNHIVKNFRNFHKKHGSDRRLIDIRDRVFAHSDLSAILKDGLPEFKLRELIEFSMAVTDLIQTLVSYSGLVHRGTVEHPIVSESSLSLRPHKFAQMDALEFWKKNFEEWGYSSKPGIKP